MSLKLWIPFTNNIENLGLDSNSKIYSVSNITYSQNGKINQYCAEFNGSNSVVIIENPPKLTHSNGFSFAFWIYVYDNLDYAAIYNGRKGIGNPISVFLYQNKLKLYDGSSNHISSSIINFNQWIHVAITRNSSNIKMYINGELQYTDTSVSFQDVLTAVKYASIGLSSINTSSASGNPLKGRLNDFRIYDHCLSIKEIKEIYKGLVTHYKLSRAVNRNLIKINKTVISTKSTYSDTGGSLINNSSFDFTTDEILANKGRTLCFSYDISAIGNRYMGDNSTDLRNRFGIHGVIIYTKNDGTTKTDYIFSKYLTYGGTSRVSMKFTIPTDMQSVSNFIFSEQFNPTEFARPADDNNETWYIKNVKLEWDYPSIYIPYSKYNNDNIIADASGYKNYALTDSNIIYCEDKDSPFGRCISFNGNMQYFTILNPFINIFKNDFTVSLWINTPGGKRGVFLGNFIETTNGISFEIRDDNKIRIYYQSIVSLISSTEISLNTWHNIVYVKEGNTFKIYIDGVFDTSTNLTNPPSSFNANLFRIGDDYRGNTQNIVSYNGKMADLKIYATALSANDINELYKIPTSVDKDGNIFTRELIEEES